MSRSARMVVILSLVVVALTAPTAFAGAPSGKNIMQPVDTSAGSISDPKKLFKVDLDAQTARVSSTQMPIEVAFNQINATTGIEFGYGEGITAQLPVSLNTSGKARDVLKALGSAAGIRFEVNGPMQLKVVRARVKEPRRAAPPPVR